MSDTHLPPPGTVLVDLSARRRERLGRDIRITITEDEPEFRCIPAVSRRHREHLFMGFFPNDTTMVRSLLHPDDRKRWDVLVGADQKWEDPQDIPYETSDGRPLLDFETVDDTMNSILTNFGIWKQPDESVVASKVRDLLADQGVTGLVANRAVAALVAVIAEDVEVTAGETVISLEERAVRQRGAALAGVPSLAPPFEPMPTAPSKTEPIEG